MKLHTKTAIIGFADENSNTRALAIDALKNVFKQDFSDNYPVGYSIVATPAPSEIAIFVAMKNDSVSEEEVKFRVQNAITIALYYRLKHPDTDYFVTWL